MSIFIMRFLFSIFLFFYLVFSVENMAMLWHKKVKVVTKGVILGKQIPLNVFDEVIIVGSEKYPHWNSKEAFIVRTLNRNGEYLIALKNKRGGASMDDNKRGWIPWWHVASFKARVVVHDSWEEAEEYSRYIFGHQIDRKSCGYCRESKEGLKSCAGCADIKSVYRIKYCGRRCQKLDWKRHREICKRKGKEEYASK